jgi:hypothetical protein
MSARLRKPQRLQQRGSPDSTKHTRTSSTEGTGYSSPQHSIGDRSDDESATVDFASVGVQGFLDFDSRPTFVVAQDANFDDGLDPIFINVSLRSNLQLVKALSIQTKSNSPQLSPKVSSTEFRAWLKDIAQLADLELLDPATFSFWGFLWTGFTIQKRWLVISGSNREMKSISGTVPQRSESSTSPTGQPSDVKKIKNSRSSSGDDILDQESPLDTSARSLYMSRVAPDWTLPQPEAALSPHIIFARSIDWGSTPLGDMSTWSPEFRQVACLLMANPHPAAVFVCMTKILALHSHPMPSIPKGFPMPM